MSLALQLLVVLQLAMVDRLVCLCICNCICVGERRCESEGRGRVAKCEECASENRDQCGWRGDGNVEWADADGVRMT